MELSLILICVFIIGVAMVAFEDKIGINKSATALLMSVVMWVLLALYGIPVDSMVVDEHLGAVSETIFFVMGALVLVELVDVHGGFRVLSQSIKTLNKRKLLWILSILTFILSAILDNIATAVIIIALLRKFVADQPTRWIYASMVIIAANAGGSFSPVGDVTTILLWTGGNISAGHQVATLILPAITCMVAPLLLANLLYFKRGETIEPLNDQSAMDGALVEIPKVHRVMMLVLAVGTMASVPLFQQATGLPPYMSILLGVSIVWVYTDRMYSKTGGNTAESTQFRLGNVFARIDMSTLMFFLGILMSVGAMKVAGTLGEVGAALESTFDDPLVMAGVIGVMSSFVDNVALVAATQGMYPVAEAGVYMANSEFWTFLAYCAVTGGSLLIIGSATGVTVMGMEKLSFGYYLKRFSLLAIIGYIAGAAVFFLLR